MSPQTYKGHLHMKADHREEIDILDAIQAKKKKAGQYGIKINPLSWGFYAPNCTLGQNCLSQSLL